MKHISNYLNEVRKATKQAQIKRGKLYYAVAYHADDCPMINGGDVCNCDVHVDIKEAGANDKA